MSSSSRSRSVPEEWMTLAYWTCASVRLLLGVVLQLAGEDQQAVERRAQLVRHVREELGLVLRGDGELLGLLLDESLGELDLLVLALDLDVLLGEAARLLAEVLVGAAQLLLARLQLLCLGLGLLEQVLGEGVGLDRVEHQPDALGELVEECLVGRAEAAERGQLDDGADRALEEDRQHDDVQRRGLAEARVDRDVVARDVGEEDALLLLRALADEALAEPELVREVLALLVAVAGLVAQHRLPPSSSPASV